AESQEVDRHGQPRVFLNNLVGVVEGGALVRAWGTQRDITDQRRVEAQRTSWLARMARLHEVTHRLSLAMSPDRVADALLQEGSDLLGAATAAIWLLDPGGTELQMLRSRGYPEKDAPFRSLGLSADAPLPEAVRTGAPIWLQSWAEYAARYPASEASVRAARPFTELAVACLPLLVEGRALGGAAFSFEGRQTFEDADRWFVQILTQHAAQGLARARLFNEVRASAARLEAVISASPATITLLDLDGTVQLWNAAAERVFGWPREEILGRKLPTTPEEQRSAFDANLQAIAAGKSIVGFEARRRRRDGSTVDVALYAAPVELPDGRRQCLTIAVDISERKRTDEALRRSEDAARFIAEATRLLGGSLKAEEIYARFAQLAVPRLADWGVILIARPDGMLETAAVAHRDPEKAAWAEEISRRYPPRPLPSGGVYEVLRTGEPELVAELAPGVLERSARDAEHLRALQSLGVTSVMSVPLSVAGRTFGAMMLISAESGRRYGAEDLRLATELASRAALAVENARLYREAEKAVQVRDEFLSVASHELRTPLTPLKLKLQSLAVETAKQSGSPYVERVQAALEASNRQVDRLSTLIGDLLDVSRIVSGRFRLEMEEIDLAALARDVVARYEGTAHEAGSSLRLETPDRLIGTWDRLRLEQVVTNLVDNAIKYGAGKPIQV
ncbi:MAG TPA: GAF domain-containing protein, partial [Myxococcaceae bacterium]|nr:GAF domain-containing protein [Myxococcaceae bacterium]